VTPFLPIDLHLFPAAVLFFFLFFFFFFKSLGFELENSASMSLFSPFPLPLPLLAGRGFFFRSRLPAMAVAVYDARRMVCWSRLFFFSFFFPLSRARSPPVLGNSLSPSDLDPPDRQEARFGAAALFDWSISFPRSARTVCRIIKPFFFPSMRPLLLLAASLPRLRGLASAAR